MECYLQLVSRGQKVLIAIEAPALSARNIRSEGITSEGGQRIRIQGANFAPETQVMAANIALTSLTKVDSQSITLTLPALPSGVTTVTVQNRGGIAQNPLAVDPVALSSLPPGYITTVAGGSTFAGDGSASSAASLNQPTAIALDSRGNMLVTDYGNNKVRRVDAATQVITTIGGNGTTGVLGDNRLAIQEGIPTPFGIALDASGHVFVATFSMIRRIDSVTGLITTVAGSNQSGNGGDNGPATAAKLSRPFDLAFDNAGNLYIADTANNRVRAIRGPIP